MFEKRKEEKCGDKILKALTTTAEYLRKIVDEKVSGANNSINAKIEKMEESLANSIVYIKDSLLGRDKAITDSVDRCANKFDVVEIIRAIDERSKEILDRVDNKLSEIDKLKIEVDTKLNEFYREFTDKYFENLNSFMRWNKDLALASKFKDDKDFSKLKRDMLLPFIKADWEQKKALNAVDVNKALASKGGALVKITELLEKQVIALGREEKPVDELKELIKNIKDLSNEDNQDTTISDSDTTPSV